MIDREDMLALTRRMTVKRTSITRIAGGYMDQEGYIDGTFNTGFLKLSPDEKEKNLQIAKQIPFADTNKNLKEYAFSSEKMKGDSMWKLLMGISKGDAEEWQYVAAFDGGAGMWSEK